MSKRKDKEDGSWKEDGRKVIRAWPSGRPGNAPRNKTREDNPRGFARSTYRAGPLRGHSSTGNDRRGGWFFRGPG